VYTINVSTMKHEENDFMDNTREAHSVQPSIGMVQPFTKQHWNIMLSSDGVTKSKWHT